MIIKRTIKFALQPQKNAASRIRMRVSYNGKRLEFQTGLVVNPDKWDNDKQRVKSLESICLLVNEMNEHLSAMLAKMIEIFHSYELAQKIPTPQELRTAFGSSNPVNVVNAPTQVSEDKNLSILKVSTNKQSEQHDFWKCYDEFGKVKGKLNDWSKASFEKFAALRNHLKAFNKDLTFDDLNENGIVDLINYLGKDQGLKNSTITKQLSLLRWFVRWAYDKGYHKNNTYEHYKPKLKTTTKHVVFLTEEELAKVEAFQAPKGKESLNVIRDVFLFCCYTGLRYSDVAKLTWDDIHDNKIEVVTKKTADRLLIDFNLKSKAILDKYSEVHLPGNKVLPVISNQKMNKQLKNLCKLVGLDTPVKNTYYEGSKRIDEVKKKYELIGTHTGRRTFICTALAKGIPPSVVMKWTGHSDYKAMQPYIDVADEVKSSYMKKFDL